MLKRLSHFSMRPFSSLQLSAGLGLLLLASCAQPVLLPPAPGSSPPAGSNVNGQSSDKAVFASATSKRVLDLEALPANSNILPGNASPVPGAATPQAAPTAAPSALPSATPMPSATSDISTGGYSTGYGYGYPGAYPTVSPGYGYGSSYGYGYGYTPFYGGGDFNTYVPVQVEENLFPGNSSQELLEVHAQTLVPMLKEWDPQARLVESRGNTAPGSAYNPSTEYVSIPGLASEQMVQLRPAWIFRYASSERKETLTVYVMHSETRVYRVSWSEPQIDLSQVKVGVTQARDVARMAIANSNNKPGYPVYPESEQFLGYGAKILYSVPDTINWTVQLSQQGKQLVYFLGFNYQEDVARPGEPVALHTPMPSGSPGFVITQVAEPTATPTALPTPLPMVTPTPFPSASPTYLGPSSAPYPQCLPEYARYVYISGSVTVDAITGKVLSLNRPVRYENYYGSYFDPSCHAPGATPYPVPTATATADI